MRCPQLKLRPLRSVGSGKNSLSRYRTAQFGDDELLESIMRGVVDLVALAEVAYSDCDVGHELVSGKWYISELKQNVSLLGLARYLVHAYDLLRWISINACTFLSCLGWMLVN